MPISRWIESGLPFSSPEGLPNPGIKTVSPTLQADSLPSEPPGKLMKSVVWSYPTLCDPMDCNPPGSSIHGIFHARILKWGAISFSRGSFKPRSPALQTDSLPSELPGKLMKCPNHQKYQITMSCNRNQHHVVGQLYLTNSQKNRSCLQLLEAGGAERSWMKAVKKY